MKTAKLARFAASTLVIGTALAGCGPASQHARPAAVSDQAVAMKKAAAYAADAFAMLGNAKANKAKAVTAAERAVALMPVNASYRALLGRAYVAAGRFASAETSFGDALALEPGDGKAALNLALMKIARGDAASALGLLEANRGAIAAADYGLALALGGDLVGALATLQEAARAPDATAKTRQNLGLVYALAGQWIEARVIASQDLSPDLVNARLSEWAQMARPRAAWDQIASLLSVTPVADAGQPAQLALVMPTNQAVAVATPNAQFAPEPVAEVAPDAVAAAEAPSPAYEVAATATPAAVVAPSTPTAAPALTIALNEPAGAAIAPPNRLEPSPLKQAVVPMSVRSKLPIEPAVVRTARAVQSGQFVVQLGAFAKAANAETAWGRLAAKVNELNNYDPVSARVTVKNASLHRLSVSGFVTREAAGQVCKQVKMSGGQCFVRSVSGDAPMQFVSRGGSTRLAARR